MPATAMEPAVAARENNVVSFFGREARRLTSNWSGTDHNIQTHCKILRDGLNLGVDLDNGLADRLTCGIPGQCLRGFVESKYAGDHGA